eukprot:gnl/Dysnectes_brevis/3735_a4788_867.p1 GENE.gnl/Dysnectes_brevis/3735_a4788_867~~gnl/Dysnectes_brevis/3735_a4788_867.p1  ORF type:complete len:289 (-),score=15.17 gnl/Dysnectes_brevis/3735_a4788_867:24-890(-)
MSAGSRICTFYIKVGACRHGDRCDRIHDKPASSRTLLFHNIYPNPIVKAQAESIMISPQKRQEHLDEYFEDIFLELDKYGPVQHLYFASNTSAHMVGNVYATFFNVEDSINAISKVGGRLYAGQRIHVEFIPLDDYRIARCRQKFRDGRCDKGDTCNYLHVMHPTLRLENSLFAANNEKWSEKHRRTYMRRNILRTSSTHSHHRPYGDRGGGRGDRYGRGDSYRGDSRDRDMYRRRDDRDRDRRSGYHGRPDRREDHRDPSRSYSRGRDGPMPRHPSRGRDGRYQYPY